MNILVITRNNWNDANNVGNTLTNIFSGLHFENGLNVYNIACSTYTPDTNICDDFFATNEKKVLLSGFKNKCCWLSLKKQEGKNKVAYTESATKKFFRAHQSMLARLAREFIWIIGRWKCKELDLYLNRIKPDVVVMPVYGTWFAHDVYRYVLAKTNAKGVLFLWDDYVSMKQGYINPFFWIHRIILRKKIEKSLNITKLKYVISPKMQEEYEKLLGERMPVMTKGYIFGDKPVYKGKEGCPLQLTYMGNVGNERWSVLAKLGQCIKKINTEAKEQVFELHVYTMSTRTEEIVTALNIKGACVLEDFLPTEKVDKVLKESDMLIHVEPFERKEQLRYRLSFSTKIVDYFMAGRCIFAIGSNTGTMDYLDRNKCAITASNEDEMLCKLTEVKQNRSILAEYANKAWDCGKANHSNEVLKTRFETDLKQLKRSEE